LVPLLSLALPCLFPGKAMQALKAAFSSLAAGAFLASNGWSIQQTMRLNLYTTNLFSDRRFDSTTAKVNLVQ
jgi:hypothetical protein